MANPISSEVWVGAIGELLVQIRLLQFGVQSAAPLKDSGNDLNAVKDEEFRCIQVKTTSAGRFPRWPEGERKYHLLAVVRLDWRSPVVLLDSSEVFLLRKCDLQQVKRQWPAMEPYALSKARVEELFIGTLAL
jgi:hypothetical protein